MGFWNALSVLAPVAPALSDAQDIRAQRQQQAQDLAQQAAAFPKEQALRDAQLTVQQLAAQSERQRLAQSAAPAQIPGTKDYYDSAQGSWMRPALVNGEFKPVKIPGQAPADELKQATSGLQDAFKAMGMTLPTNVVADLGYRIYGGTGALPAAGSASTLYRPLPGAAGQPRLGADGKSYVRAVIDPATNQVVDQPMPADYKPPAAKPLSPAVRYTNLAAKQILASQGKGPALTPEELADLTASRSELTLNGVSTANARAIANARYGITNVTDDSGEEVAQNRLNVANAAAAGTPYAAGAVGAPTGSDKKNSILAQSAIQQVNRMQAILKSDPQLVGPGNGQLTQLQKWLGTQSPDAQQFLISSLLSSEHGVAVFGGRNIHTINDLQQALGSMKTNPAALSAALDVVKETMVPFATAGGRLPGAGGAAVVGSGVGTGTGRTAPPAPAPPANTITLHAGGKTYNIPRDQVAAFRKDHPDARQ